MSISVVIPTYDREDILIDTLNHVAGLNPGTCEILLVDQTKEHSPKTTEALSAMAKKNVIRHIHLPTPSIPKAMNIGLKESSGDIVLFLDDDVIPAEELISAHLSSHKVNDSVIVAGRVLQPWDKDEENGSQTAFFTFASRQGQYVCEFMGGNFSIDRNAALRLGGFDENFVHAAYRFEKEFADRVLLAGGNIYFEPKALIRHLKASAGGTRTFGNHLRTIKPSHSVGAYYYLLKSRRVKNKLPEILIRPMRAIRTRHHLCRPWWILPTLLAEILGFCWAVFLYLRGPRLIKERGVVDG